MTTDEPLACFFPGQYLVCIDGLLTGEQSQAQLDVKASPEETAVAESIMNATSCGIPVIRGEPIPSIDEESSAAMNSGEASSLTLTATGGTQLSYEFSQSVQDMRDRDEKFRSSQLAQTQESLVQQKTRRALAAGSFMEMW